MNEANFIRQSLAFHDITVFQADIPYIEFLLHTVMQSQTALQAFPDLNSESPITVMDKGLIE